MSSASCVLVSLWESGGTCGPEEHPLPIAFRHLFTFGLCREVNSFCGGVVVWIDRHCIVYFFAISGSSPKCLRLACQRLNGPLQERQFAPDQGICDKSAHGRIETIGTWAHLSEVLQIVGVERPGTRKKRSEAC